MTTSFEPDGPFHMNLPKFILPGHIRRPIFKIDQCSHVIDDIYRPPKIEVKPTTASPLDPQEEAHHLMKSFVPKEPEQTVVEASASANRALSRLGQLAKGGDGKALWQLATLATCVVGELAEIVDKNPAVVTPLARQMTQWPMLRSTAPPLDSDIDLLYKIELGKETERQLDKLCKWKPDNAMAYATALISHIERIRAKNPKVLAGGKKMHFADILPPFDSKTRGQWWDLAKQLLLGAYPAPEQIEELDALVVNLSSKRKYPSQRRAAILEKIRARFFAIACQS